MQQVNQHKEEAIRYLDSQSRNLTRPQVGRLKRVLQDHVEGMTESEQASYTINYMMDLMQVFREEPKRHYIEILEHMCHNMRVGNLVWTGIDFHAAAERVEYLERHPAQAHAQARLQEQVQELPDINEARRGGGGRSAGTKGNKTRPKVKPKQKPSSLRL